MAIVEIQTPTERLDAIQAADSRFFYNHELCLQQTLPGMLADIWAPQAIIAKKALLRLQKIEQAQEIIGRADFYPKLFSVDQIDEAHGEINDSGTIWRRETDQISREVAGRLPCTYLGRLVLGKGIFFTDETSMLERDLSSGQTTVYRNIISKPPGQENTRIADIDQWKALLFQITTII